MAESALPRTRRRHERRQGDPRRAERRRRGVGDVAAHDGDAASGLGGAGSGGVVAGDARVDRGGAREAERRADRRDRDLGADALVGLPRPRGRRDSSRAALVRRPHDGGVRGDHDARRRGGAAARPRVESRRSRDSRCRRCSGCGGTSPTAFARLATVLLPKDYIRYRLTGELATEPSDASATLMYDTAHLRWSEEIMRAVELPMSLLPNVGAVGGGARTRERGRRGSHGTRRGRAGRRRRRGQRVRRGGSRRHRAGRSRDELGDVRARCSRRPRVRSSIRDSAPTPSATCCPTCGT